MEPFYVARHDRQGSYTLGFRGFERFTRLPQREDCVASTKRRENYSRVRLTERLLNYSNTLGSGFIAGPIRHGGCNGSFCFELIYLQQAFNVAGHDQAEIFNLEL